MKQSKELIPQEFYINVGDDIKLEDLRDNCYIYEDLNESLLSAHTESEDLAGTSISIYKVTRIATHKKV